MLSFSPLSHPPPPLSRLLSFIFNLFQSLSISLTPLSLALLSLGFSLLSPLSLSLSSSRLHSLSPSPPFSLPFTVLLFSLIDFMPDHVEDLSGFHPLRPSSQMSTVLSLSLSNTVFSCVLTLLTQSISTFCCLLLDQLGDDANLFHLQAGRVPPSSFPTRQYN